MVELQWQTQASSQVGPTTLKMGWREWKMETARRHHYSKGQKFVKLSPQVASFIFLSILTLLLLSLRITHSHEAHHAKAQRSQHFWNQQETSAVDYQNPSSIESPNFEINNNSSDNRFKWAAVGDLLRQKSFNAFKPAAAALVAASNNVGATQSNEASRARGKSLHSILKSAATIAASPSSSASTTAGNSSSGGTGGGVGKGSSEYKCAKYCSCSIVQVTDRRSKGIEQLVNLTRAKCESSKFDDVLTIDRKTQIIHISLPSEETQMSNLNNKNSIQQEQASNKSFRMPRLVQFNILREIVIVNLKFEVCDSEVFKRGQKLRRLQLNHNKLYRISKACLRYLDKLIELNLDHNNLQKLESALFSSLLSLRTLSIAHNQLSELSAHQFANLTQLTTLNFVGNSFKQINLHLFEPMQNSLRMLILAKNQIRSFVYSPILLPSSSTTTTTRQDNILSPLAASNTNQTLVKVQPTNLTISVATSSVVQLRSSLLAGVVFKNLIKLNVDQNRLERIKLLQLHRFFNVKFLSIRQNNIATIRDKAFNGLKLIELNLAHNKLQTISKCAFCNATIKRLALSNNNISLPLPNTNMLLNSAVSPNNQQLPLPLASILNESTINQQPQSQAQKQLNPVDLPEPQALQSTAPAATVAPAATLGTEQLAASVPTASSSQNMLILSQSLFGPLFAQLEFLDLSMNELLAEQLDYLLEPLLNLEYLNLASTGLDRSLVSPTIFKNLRQLKYLNLSHNQLDQLISETIEPLQQLEILDLSHNKFSELDESFLVTLDDITSLKVINFGSNPWYCSQCKVAPLYDWILRSSIYNLTCIAPANQLQQDSNNSDDSSPGVDPTSVGGGNDDINTESITTLHDGGLSYSPRFIPSDGSISTRGPQHDYSLLVGGEFGGDIYDKLEPNTDSLLNTSPIIAGGLQLQDEDLLANYNLLTSSLMGPEGGGLSSQQLAALQQQLWSVRDLISSAEDDPTISDIITSTLMSVQSRTFNSSDYCLRCEFPHELHTYNLHDLSSGDFKFCAGAAPRFAASEPKIGLTLALVIIGALFCIIIVVIVMYRRKTNTYYTNEDMARLNGAGSNGVNTSGKKLMSVSSEAEHQYGDATDYSSPPMSQSYEESYTQDDEDEEEEDEDEEYDEDEEEEEDEEEGEELELDEDSEETPGLTTENSARQHSRDNNLIEDPASSVGQSSMAHHDNHQLSAKRATVHIANDQGHRGQANELEVEGITTTTTRPNNNSQSSRLNQSGIEGGPAQKQHQSLINPQTVSRGGGLKPIRNKSQSSMQSNQSLTGHQPPSTVRGKPLWAELSVTSLEQEGAAAATSVISSATNLDNLTNPKRGKHSAIKLSHSSGSQTMDPSKLLGREMSGEVSLSKQQQQLDDRQNHNRHLAGSSSFRLDSASNSLAAKFSRVATSKEQQTRQTSTERRPQQSDKKSRGTTVKSPPKQTIYQLAAASLQSSQPSGADFAPPSSKDSVPPIQSKQATNGRLHRPAPLSQMNRQRFAISKEMSSQPSVGMLQASASERLDFVGPRKQPDDNLDRSEVPQGHQKQHTQQQNLVRGTTLNALNRADDEEFGKAYKSNTASEDLLHMEHTSRRGELHQMAHQANVRSATPVSDATTADSLALEALDYGGSLDEGDDEADLLGGALEVESSLEPDFEIQPSGALVSLGNENLLQPSISNIHQQQHHGYVDTHSTHSALTQTGSKDLID